MTYQNLNKMMKWAHVLGVPLTLRVRLAGMYKIECEKLLE